MEAERMDEQQVGQVDHTLHPELTEGSEELIAEKSLRRIARVISALFTPFTIPFVAFLILFIFS